MADRNLHDTMYFNREMDTRARVDSILSTVYEALKERGYDPKSQLVGYLISGDPTYITSHKDARSLIRRLERDEILEGLVEYYLEYLDSKEEEN